MGATQPQQKHVVAAAAGCLAVAREDALDVAMGPRFAEMVERSFKRDT